MTQDEDKERRRRALRQLQDDEKEEPVPGYGKRDGKREKRGAMAEPFRHIKALASIYMVLGVVSLLVGLTLFAFALGDDRGTPMFWLTYAVVAPVAFIGVGEGIQVFLAIEGHLRALREEVAAVRKDNQVSLDLRALREEVAAVREEVAAVREDIGAAMVARGTSPSGR